MTQKPEPIYKAVYNNKKEQKDSSKCQINELDICKDKMGKSLFGLVLKVPYDIVINKFFGIPEVDLNGSEVCQLIFELANSDTDNEGFIVDINDVRSTFFECIGQFIQNTTFIEKGVPAPPKDILIWPEIIRVNFSPSIENISSFIFFEFSPIVRSKFNVDLVSVTTVTSIGSATFSKRSILFV